MNIERYVDPTRHMRLQIRFLLFTTLWFAIWALIAAYNSADWKNRAIQWQFQALSGGRGDEP